MLRDDGAYTCDLCATAVGVRFADYYWCCDGCAAKYLDNLNREQTDVTRRVPISDPCLIPRRSHRAAEFGVQMPCVITKPC